MPTRNRRRFVSQAIWYFLRQDYSPRELIVIDDGEDRLADLIPNDSRIRYVRVPQPLSVRAKHNLARSLCTGEFVAHWDDDVWYAPWRLSAQLERLQQSRVPVTALRGSMYYQPLTGRVWRHEARGGTKGLLHAGTLLYSRGFGDTHNSAADTCREAGLSMLRLANGELDFEDGSNLAIAVLDGNKIGRASGRDRV